MVPPQRGFLETHHFFCFCYHDDEEMSQQRNTARNVYDEEPE